MIEYQESELSLVNSSCIFDNAIETKRTQQVYAMVEVVSCHHKDWWYRNLIGIKFLCMLRFSTSMKGKYVSDFICVRLTNTKIIIGRGFDPKDVIII